MERERIIEIDILKGIGILLVILGHCIPEFPMNLREDVNSYTLLKVIYSFHMPLFFFCSGYALQLSNKGNGVGIRSRFKRLMIPYLFFSIMSLLLRLLFSKFTRSSVDLWDGVFGILFTGKFYWFLYVLFFIIVMINTFKLFTKKIWIWMLAAVLLYVIGYITDTVFLCLNRIGYYAIFTVYGYWHASEKNKIDVVFKRKICLGVLAISFFILMIIQFNTGIVFADQLMRFVKSFIGIWAAYSVCKYYNKFRFLNPIFLYFSKYSLQFYLIHMMVALPCYYIVAMMDFSIPIISVLMNFILIVFISYIILNLMRRCFYIYDLAGMPRNKCEVKTRI